MRALLIGLLLSLASAASAQSWYADGNPGWGGLTAGVRAGYATPLGDFAGASDGSTLRLRDEFSGQVPFWMEVGARFARRIFLGVYLQIGYPFVEETGPGLAAAECNAEGVVSCSGDADVRAGLELQVNLLPDERVQPWIGLGLGLGTGRTMYRLEDAEGATATVTYRYRELVNVQAGLDYRPYRKVALGPYTVLSVGRYEEVEISSNDITLASVDIADRRIHEWLQFGVRLSADL